MFWVDCGHVFEAVLQTNGVTVSKAKNVRCWHFTDTPVFKIDLYIFTEVFV